MLIFSFSCFITVAWLSTVIPQLNFDSSYPITPFLYYNKPICFGAIKKTSLNYQTCSNFHFASFSELLSSNISLKGPNGIFHYIVPVKLFSRLINLYLFTLSLTQSSIKLLHSCSYLPVFFVLIYVIIIMISFLPH